MSIDSARTAVAVSCRITTSLEPHSIASALVLKSSTEPDAQTINRTSVGSRSATFRLLGSSSPSATSSASPSRPTWLCHQRAESRAHRRWMTVPRGRSTPVSPGQSCAGRSSERARHRGWSSPRASLLVRIIHLTPDQPCDCLASPRDGQHEDAEPRGRQVLPVDTRPVVLALEVPQGISLVRLNQVRAAGAKQRSATDPGIGHLPDVRRARPGPYSRQPRRRSETPKT
jgi:hypothetical protein